MAARGGLGPPRGPIASDETPIPDRWPLRRTSPSPPQRPRPSGSSPARGMPQASDETPAAPSRRRNEGRASRKTNPQLPRARRQRRVPREARHSRRHRRTSATSLLRVPHRAGPTPADPARSDRSVRSHTARSRSRERVLRPSEVLTVASRRGGRRLGDPWAVKLGNDGSQRCRMSHRAARDEEQPGTGDRSCQRHGQQHHDPPRLLDARQQARRRGRSTEHHQSPQRAGEQRTDQDQDHLPGRRVIRLHELRGEQHQGERETEADRNQRLRRRTCEARPVSTRSRASRRLAYGLQQSASAARPAAALGVPRVDAKPTPRPPRSATRRSSMSTANPLECNAQ